MATRTKGKIACALIAFLLLGGIGFTLLKKKDIDIQGQALYVMDLEDGKTKLKKNSGEKRAPSSLVKGMTALVALEKIEDLDKKVPVDVNFYKKMVAENASMAGFHGRERVTYRDLLYGMLLASGGECAGTLAVQTGGTEEHFVQMMNEKAGDLGLKNTRFKNPTGMDEKGQYTTAEDMARLYRKLFKNPDLRKILTTNFYQSSQTLDHPQGLSIYSTILSSLDEGEEAMILGGKSGTTPEGGKSWASLVRKGDRDYVCVVLGTDFDSRDYDLVKADTLKVLKKL